MRVGLWAVSQAKEGVILRKNYNQKHISSQPMFSKFHGIPDTDVGWQTSDFHFCLCPREEKSLVHPCEPELSPEVLLRGLVAQEWASPADTCQVPPTGEGHLQAGPSLPGRAQGCTPAGDGFRWASTFISVAVQLVDCLVGKCWHHYCTK